jgi:hypothetical protein
MKQLIKSYLNKMPYIKGLHQQIEKQGAYPAGHYYSPIPDKDEILSYTQTRSLIKMDIPGIELNTESQFRLLNEYSHFYKDLPFPDKQTPDCRFYYQNTVYSYSDAVFLYSFLRKHKPKRIIEIGSGFSSAVMLDTIDRCFSNHPEIILIEPYTARLKSLLKKGDEDKMKILDKKIQDVSLGLFSSLEAGDLLFIDSSHVVKSGSDLQLLMFDILPSLPSGIFIHFHDIFYPFEYPFDWLKKGRYWNEDYFLRAFLSYNCEWSIYFFNSYVSFAFKDFIHEKMPICLKSPGGSLYIQSIERE